MKEKLAHFVRLHRHQSLFAAFEILLRNPILKIREGKSTEKILSLSAIAKTKVSTQLCQLFIVNFEHISNFFLVFLLLNLNT